jgi:hypothetical protein
MSHVAAEGSRDSPAVPYLDLRPRLAGAEPVHLLKCDIEGSEQAFLESYAPHLGAVRSVVIELHHDRCDTRRCLELLERAGFVGRRVLREAPTFSVVLLWR